MTLKRATRKIQLTKRVKLADVCKAAGVSKAAISYVLNDKPGVSPEMRRKIKSLMRKMGYLPTPAARHLSLARSETIAAIFQDLTAGWLLTVFRGIAAQAAESKYQLIAALSSQYGDEFKLPTEVLARASVDGFLWMDPRVRPVLVKRFKKQPIPFVVIQGHIDDPEINTVSIENSNGAYDAVRHLLQLGYRRLMLMTGQEDNVDSLDKLAGARRALREFGVTLPKEYILNGHHVASYAVEAMNAFAESGRPMPEAIFAFNDDMALAVLRWLRDRRLRVPEDVALVGFDGVDEAKGAELTTVETPIREMGMTAAKLLIETIRTPPEQRKSKHILLDGHLAVRKTCGAHLRQPA